MARIDDPDGQLEQQLREPTTAFDVGSFALQLTTMLTGVLSLGKSAAVLAFSSFARDYYSSTRTQQRLEELVKHIDSTVEEWRRSNIAGIEEFKTRLAAHDADRDNAIARAILETTLGTTAETIRRFGDAIGNQLVKQPATWEEVNGFISDLVRLTEEDLRALSVLFRRHSSLAGSGDHMPPNLHAFHDRHRLILETDVPAAGYVTADDFYSTCSRLAGFGLALEVPRNPSFQRPNEICFRLSTRGLKLGRLLGLSSAE